MTTNAQVDFLNDIKDKKVSVTVFLINGVKLQGVKPGLTGRLCC